MPIVGIEGMLMAPRLVLRSPRAEAGIRRHQRETPVVTLRPWASAPADLVALTPLGLYIHVPFCARRCGYCAFNTYTTAELSSATRGAYVEGARTEIRIAAQATAGAAARPALESVYFGGGTPTMLSIAEIESILAEVHEHFGLDADTEITIEANPDGIDRNYIRQLFALGVNRVSFGMQSTSQRVLNLLDRTHDPELALRAVEHAHSAGFEHVSLDLIYGTPGERPHDFVASLDAAVSTGVDHVSAYALGIEPGTKLAARVRNGALLRPSDDEAAQRYTTADELLGQSGFDWYEISNWARGPEARSRHNLLYWTNANWWGIGPGAHSHLSGIRWWNVNHPDLWAGALAGGDADSGATFNGDPGRTQVAGFEALDPGQRRLERVMLEIRLASGLEVDELLDVAAIEQLVDDGLVSTSSIPGRLVLTLQGRLLADHVIDRLT